MVNRNSLTVTVAFLGRPFSFSRTVSVTAASPCPEAGVNVIHGASLAAVQPHSRAMPTLVATVPPAAATVCAGALSATTHLSLGPARSVTLVAPHAAANSADMNRMGIAAGQRVDGCVSTARPASNLDRNPMAIRVSGDRTGRRPRGSQAAVYRNRTPAGWPICRWGDLPSKSRL